MRKGCRTSKTEKACPDYSYQLLRCKFGRVKATCPRCEQAAPGTKAAKDAEFVKDFYT